MHPSKVNHQQLRHLTDLPNVGYAVAQDLQLLGICTPAELIGQNAYDLYERLCSHTGSWHNPCMIDVFLSIIDFMHGDQPKPWWHYTAERKALLSQGK
ncbi:MULTISPECIES: helix-hairpin-helix domain-containing protein [Eikenella]|uniref:Mitomycin resistance protein n=1 Tax=Eikenella exigua TaxID=2528037 RepID=A0AAX1F6W1_9NEIS|nr:MULTISPECIES: helix-hairpin-helix domain-containing protein [Eikenella]OAM28936.1 mitomycin resistance protein [Eikenella sp. NML01-A-086]OAM40939.1 mitomycin resistance protein [Eikenella sp. NML97-A-109]QED91806.1 mitomycin resistance protein [Eikenella exigua]